MVFIVETSYVSFVLTICVAKNLSLRHEVRQPLKLKDNKQKMRIDHGGASKKQQFCVHRQSTPISKPVSCSHVSHVEDKEGNSGLFQAKCHLHASIDGFHPETAASQ
jgi:hypothetical protein